VTRQRAKLIGYAGLLASILAVIGYLEFIRTPDDEPDKQYNLTETIADLDLKEPGWRLEDLEAQRQAVPDDENGALCVLAARKLLPEKWPALEFSTKLPVNLWEKQLSQDQINIIADELRERRPAVEKAKQLESLPRGRYPIKLPAHGMIECNHVQSAQTIANLLEYQLVLQVHQGQRDEAWRTCVAILNVSRSLGDEPLLPSQETRMGIRRKAMQAMLQVLRNGEVSDARLMNAEGQLKEESNFPLFLIGLRGERASQHRLWTEFATGRLDVTHTFGLNKKYRKKDGMFWETRDTLADVSHAWVLQFFTEAIKVIQQPLGKQSFSLSQLSEKPRPQLYPLADGWTNNDGISRIIIREKYDRAYLYCVRAALAAERFRMRRGNWPESLSALVPEYLDQMSIDLFDDKPLCYHQLDSQIQIYSAILEKADDGYLIPPGTGRGVEVLNPDCRREVKGAISR
jgi:hypothetical protein